jgi:hypothetical protein
VQIIAAIYGFLVGELTLTNGDYDNLQMCCLVFWGAAIVLFLTKMINLHNDYRQGLWVEISSQVVNGKEPAFLAASELTFHQAFLRSLALGSSLLVYWTLIVNSNDHYLF